jgi:hypothetical protein
MTGCNDSSGVARRVLWNGSVGDGPIAAAAAMMPGTAAQAVLARRGRGPGGPQVPDVRSVFDISHATGAVTDLPDPDRTTTHFAHSPFTYIGGCVAGW